MPVAKHGRKAAPLLSSEQVFDKCAEYILMQLNKTSVL